MVEDFLERGLSQLMIVTSSSHFDHVLECMSNLTPYFFDQSEMVSYYYTWQFFALFIFREKANKIFKFFAKIAKNAKKYIIRKYSLKLSTFKKNTIAGYIRKIFHVNIYLYKCILMLSFFYL